VRRRSLVWAGLALALSGSTCRDSRLTGPGARAHTAIDLSAFAVAAPGDPPVPIDSFDVTLLRSDQSVALDTAVTRAAVAEGDSFVVRLSVPLAQETEDLLLALRAFGSGVDWYTASSAVRLVAGQVTTANLLATYVGPGAAADSVRLQLAATRLLGGVPVSVAAVVYGPGGTPVPGVPVGYRVTDATVASLSGALLNTATLTGAQPVNGSTWLVARTPTGLLDSVLISIVPPPAQLVTVGGDGQTGPPDVPLPAPFVVQVLDGLGGPFEGQTVAWTVTAGAATLTATTTVTDAGGLASVVATPSAGGTLTVQAAAPGLAGSPQTFTAGIGAAGPASVVAVAGDAQTATVGTAVPIAPTVLVRNAVNDPVSGVAVAFAIGSGGGTVTGATPVTDANGLATVGSWTLGTTAGPNTLTATVAGLTPVTFSATGAPGPVATLSIVSGDGQTADAGTPLGAPLVVAAADAHANPVSSVPVAWSASDGSVTPSNGTTDANGRAQASWTLGTNSTGQTATAVVSGLPAAVFSATALFPTPTILMTVLGGDRVPVGGSRDLQVTLTTPAGAGGVTVTVSSDNTSIVSPAAPGTLSIAQGQSTGTIAVNGVGTGTTIVRANASGYLEGTLSVTASIQVLSVPVTLNVPFGQTASLPLQISTPAPAGGTQVTLVSSDPSFVGVATPTVTIPAGAQTANATLAGVLPGTATVTATTADFGSAQSTVSTTANLNIIESSATLNESFGTSVTLRFESQGIPVAAPAPGIIASLSAAVPGCLTVPATATIPTGLVQTTVPLSYGGSAATPCSTTLTAAAPDIAPDAINVTVNPTPAITLFAVTVGSGLQDNASGSLGAAVPAGGLTVTLTSSNPAVALVAPNAERDDAGGGIDRSRAEPGGGVVCLLRAGAGGGDGGGDGEGGGDGIHRRDDDADGGAAGAGRDRADDEHDDADGGRSVPGAAGGAERDESVHQRGAGGAGGRDGGDGDADEQRADGGAAGDDGTDGADGDGEHRAGAGALTDDGGEWGCGV